jgi:hypothetical protein
LRVLRLDVSVYITNQFQTTFAQVRGGGRGVKIKSRDDCEWQGGKLLRPCLNLRPRKFGLRTRTVLVLLAVRQKTGERETCLNRRGDHGDDGDEDGGNDIHDGKDEVHLQHVPFN